MKKLPKINVVPASEQELARLHRWIYEREIDLAMQDADIPAEPENSGSSVITLLPDVTHVNQPDTAMAPEPGQIRLLRPDSPHTDAYPRYLAILREWEDDTVLTAPFSRYAEPATGGELETGRDIPCLRTLSLWNTHSVPEKYLRDSWLADALSPEELSDAWSVFRSCSMGVDLEEDLRSRTGPPVVHPEDPRIPYQEEEVQWMQGWIRHQARKKQVRKAVEQKAEIIELTWARDFAESTRMALAADGIAYRAHSAMYRVGETELMLEVAAHSNEVDCTLTVYDSEGAPSDLLNGCCIAPVDDPGMITVIDAAKTVAPLKTVLNGFIMLDAEGEVLALQEIQE